MHITTTAAAAFIAATLSAPAFAAEAHTAPVHQVATRPHAVIPDLRVQVMPRVATEPGEMVSVLVSNQSRHNVAIGRVEEKYDRAGAFVFIHDYCAGQILTPHGVTCEVRYAYTGGFSHHGKNHGAIVIIHDTAGNEVGGTVLLAEPQQPAHQPGGRPHA